MADRFHAAFTRSEIERYYRHHVGDLRAIGGEFRVGCPLHGSDHRVDSLAINRESGVWFCHSACGTGGSLIDFEIRISGCDFKQACANIAGIIGQEILHPKSRVVATYDYTDASLTLLYQVQRLFPKRFRARRPDGQGGWIYNLKDTPRVLYNLPAVLRAEVVFVTEGEKDADNLIFRGLTATTCAFGAKHWRAEYSLWLINKLVILIPDCDQAGSLHREMVGRSLVGKARSIKVIALPAEWPSRPITESFDYAH